MHLDNSSLGDRILLAQRKIDRLMGERDSLQEALSKLELSLTDLRKDMEDYEKIAVLLATVGDEQQAHVQELIESLVTRGLQTIFDSSLSFRIETHRSGKTSTAEFLVETDLGDGKPLATSVMDARGGGVAAVIGFLLRLVVMLLSKRHGDLLLLDESFAHVSDDHLDALGGFLRDLVEETGLQIVMITHQPVFVDYADKAYRFRTVSGKTQVESVVS